MCRNVLNYDVYLVGLALLTPPDQIFQTVFNFISEPSAAAAEGSGALRIEGSGALPFLRSLAQHAAEFPPGVG